MKKENIPEGESSQIIYSMYVYVFSRVFERGNGARHFVKNGSGCREDCLLAMCHLRVCVLVVDVVGHPLLTITHHLSHSQNISTY